MKTPRSTKRHFGQTKNNSLIEVLEIGSWNTSGMNGKEKEKVLQKQRRM